MDIKMLSARGQYLTVPLVCSSPCVLIAEGGGKADQELWWDAGVFDRRKLLFSALYWDLNGDF